MSTLTSIFTLQKSTQATVSWTVGQLLACGLQVEQTFDLQAARLAHAECPCPHHGTNNCSCQMVVLLVRFHGSQPVTLIAHGYDGQTNLSVAGTGNQTLETKVFRALFPVIREAEA